MPIKNNNYETVNYLETDDNPQYSLVIKSKDHRRQILTENKIVCIDLHADWCQPCKSVAPDYNKLAKQYNIPGKCMLVKENVELNLTTDCNITSIPTFIFYMNGQLLKDENQSDVKVIGGDINKVKNILDTLL